MRKSIIRKIFLVFKGEKGIQQEEFISGEILPFPFRGRADLIIETDQRKKLSITRQEKQLMTNWIFMLLLYEEDKNVKEEDILIFGMEFFFRQEKRP